MNCSTPGLPVHHQLLEFTQTHVHWASGAIQQSHPLSSPSSPAFNLSQHQGLFQWLSSSLQVVKVLEFQLQHQSFQWTLRIHLHEDGLVGSPCSPRDSQEPSPTPQFKSINALALSFLYSPYMTTGKTIALTKWTFVGGVMSLFFNMLFRLIIAFLPRSKHLLIGYRNSKLWDISFQRNKMKIRLDEKEQSDREQGSIKSHFKSPQNLQNFAASI